MGSERQGAFVIGASLETFPHLNSKRTETFPHLNDLSLRLRGAGGGSKARLELRGAPRRPRNSQTKSLTTRHKLGLSKNYLYTHTGPAPGPGIGGAEFRRRVAVVDVANLVQDLK